MKGAAHLFLDTFSNKGDRLLTDLDILVPFDKIEQVSTKFAAAGYKFTDDKMHFIETHHHYPPLIKQGEYASIELHRDLISRKQQHLLLTESAWRNTVDIELPNSARAKVLTPNYRILHSFIHSCIVDALHLKGYAEIRQLHELARSHYVYSSKIDWQEIMAYARKHNITEKLFANLYVAKKFMQIPDVTDIDNKYYPGAIFQYLRVCFKLRYNWFNIWDARIVRRIRRWQTKGVSPG